MGKLAWFAKGNKALDFVRKVVCFCGAICGEIEDERNLGRYLWKDAFAQHWKSLEDEFNSPRESAVLASSIPASVVCVWMQFYFYAWPARSSALDSPVLRYDAKTTTLECIPPYGMSSLYTRLPVDSSTLPVHGTVSIDRRTNAVKFMFDHSIDTDKTAAIELSIDYSVAARSDSKAALDDNPSRGLLAAIAEKVKGRQIITVANSVTRLLSEQHGQYRLEDGRVQLTVDGRGFPPGAWLLKRTTSPWIRFWGVLNRYDISNGTAVRSNLRSHCV